MSVSYAVLLHTEQTIWPVEEFWHFTPYHGSDFPFSMRYLQTFLLTRLLTYARQTWPKE